MVETRLKSLRKKTGMSAYGFAGLLPITREYYYMLERGEHRPGPSTRFAIIQRLSEKLNHSKADIERELEQEESRVVSAA